jgi:hypothetical protein
LEIVRDDDHHVTAPLDLGGVAADARPGISPAAANMVIRNIRRRKASLVVAVASVGVAAPTPLPLIEIAFNRM